MKLISLKQAKNVLLILIINFTILIISFQRKRSYTIELKYDIGTIEGNIENYDGIYKSGKLSYFEAINRIIQSEIFAIDSSDNFKSGIYCI
jgi:hypothetical protein